MVAYLDTNVYIGAKYQFSVDKFATLQKLIEDGDIIVLVTNATIGEVEQHIATDIKAGVSQYNRVLRKEIPVITTMEALEVSAINEAEALTAVKDGFSQFLALEGVRRIALNPLDVEQLMTDYFQGNPPFETKKPYEFKDAIVINAIKRYRREMCEPIVVVSSDDGFRRAFEDSSSFITVKYLGDLIRLCQEQKEEYTHIEECITAAIENDEFEDAIRDHFSSFDIDRGYYSEWECDEFEIDELETALAYIEHTDERSFAHINVVIYISAEITHRDEDASYFDREEQRYLVENFVTWREKHRLELETTIKCIAAKDSLGDYTVTKFEVADERKFRTLDLDEGTMQDWDVLEIETQEEPDLIYCSECGKLLGYKIPYADYDHNPLCGDCMVSDSKGDICPACGRKVPYELMFGDFCLDCYKEQD